MSCKGCGQKVGKIAKGWTSLVFQRAQPEAKRRLTICRNCSSNRWKGLRMWCKECRCYIPAKVRVPEEKCKLNRW